ncbi:Hpt domain-containing protein [Zoogloea sp.]|uniref:Hpt domain-containing protein n=1 Tax=Zoogloea sp. TaxID=49181 RepID=UPI0032207DAF
MIQRDKLESRYAGRAAFVERLLGVFASTHAPLSGELRRAVENGDALGIARLAHQIKGSAGNVMDSDLQLLAQRTEHAAREMRPEGIELALDLADALDLTLAAIDT